MSGLFADRYRRLSSLGRGAMGEVWLADDLVLGRRVAIKQLRIDAGAGADQVAVERMVREARVAARLDHPNVVGVYDLLTVDGQPYVVMQFVDGESLAERLRRTGPIPVVEALALFGPLAHGLETAHRAGVVHRDIKPANILITGAGVAKLADFGIARQHGDAELTDTGQMIGTLAYMSPDIARGAAASAATDMWSFGATLYAALEGRAPYGSTGQQSTASMLVRLVTEPVPTPGRADVLAPLLGRLLDVDPARRPSAEEVGRAVAVLAASVTTSTVADSTRQRPVAVTPPPVAEGGTSRVVSDVDPTTVRRPGLTGQNSSGGHPVTSPPVRPIESTVTVPRFDPPTPRRRQGRLVGAVIVVALLIAGVGGWALVTGSSSDPSRVADRSSSPRVSIPNAATSTMSRSTSSTAAGGGGTGSAPSTTVAARQTQTVSTSAFSYVDPDYGYRFSVGPGLVNPSTRSRPEQREWSSSDGTATLTVSVLDYVPAEPVDACAVDPTATVTYSFHDSHKCIVSGYTDSGGVYYVLVVPATRNTYRLEWTYPASDKARWKSDNARSADTFQAGPS